MRADELRATGSGALVGGHLLQVWPADPPGSPLPGHLRWQLRCGGCLALLDGGALHRAGPLLAGAQSIPATGGHPAVSWAYGASDSPPMAQPGPGSVAAAANWPAATVGGLIDRVDVVFGRGFRRPVLAPAHPLPGGMWVAAAPGRARRVVVLSPGTPGGQRRPDQLDVPGCRGLQSPPQ